MSADFDLSLLEAGLEETCFAGRAHHLSVTDSTNRVALEAASAGARESAWIADEQTAGRGRGGHGWHSVAGDGLYLSLLVRPRLPMRLAMNLPLAAGLAVQAALREVTGVSIDLRWPNDLMLGAAKCGGILVESSSGPEEGSGEAMLRAAVIGVGLNLNHRGFPEELGGTATSLRMLTGLVYRREPLVAAILRETEREVTRLLRESQGTPEGKTLLSRFAEASTWVAGMRVQVAEEGGYTGWTRGLDDRGFLLVEDDQGAMRTVRSGGVRPAQA